LTLTHTLLLFYENEEPVFLLVRHCNLDDYVYLCRDASAAAYAADLTDIGIIVTL
jgi:hypothetical protein